jgi:uncharacterized protein YbcC (UPF0753/DUF2309 family)
MSHTAIAFNEYETLHELRHYLPAQAPLKDFIHHNTLHAFQHKKFFEALRYASEMFGYKTLLSLEDYRLLHTKNKIKTEVLDRILINRFGRKNLQTWKTKVLSTTYDMSNLPRIGKMRAQWDKIYDMDIDVFVQPQLFKTVCSYLDQGIAIWGFPAVNDGFLSSLREMEKSAYTSFFNTPRARHLLLNTECRLADLLKILVGDDILYRDYLFDQQFAHQGWSGMVATIETQPESLLDRRKISLKDFIAFELLLEIDALDNKFGEIWAPLAAKLPERTQSLFDDIPETEPYTVLSVLQEAFEWTYYDEVLGAIATNPTSPDMTGSRSMQLMFCIDDRECSIRRYIEKLDPSAETFGTPGFFGVEFYFQPEFGKSYTKLCPAPITPAHLIKEIDTLEKRKKEFHLTKYSHDLFRGWFMSQTLGFWAILRLFMNVFRPTMSAAAATSFRHMDRFSKLTIENKDPFDQENGLQIGFTPAEMANRVESLLKSIGLIKDFAPIVYVIGHGSSSVNNPHYAAYDCGACCGRPGSVNARVLCYMANHSEVRAILKERGLLIPESTQFLGGLHDTTRDEFAFFDEDELSSENKIKHRQHLGLFHQALDLNAKERSRRLASIDTHQSASDIHKQILIRSVSLFEPRPELNHATNALCIVGGRSLSNGLFLDRRSFMNSYDYRIDPNGEILANIMKPLGPVCGGINLEYFFSRVDNHKMGAGTKLPHNVMGLFGVANGVDGDLRPGLPSQMIEVHDPVRLMIIVEHYPDVLLKTVKSSDAMYEWFNNDWVHLVAVHPETRELFCFGDGAFKAYSPLTTNIETIADITPVIESNEDNIHVYRLKSA